MVETPVSLLEQLCTTSSPIAWERFVLLYTPLLQYWTRKLCNQSAETSDFLQELYLKLLRALPSFQYQKEKRFRGWLWTLTLNLWRDQQRRKVKEPEPLEAATAVTHPEHDEMDELEYRRYLINRMMQLIRREFDSKSWQACWEVACQGRPVAEVANELGLSSNAVYIARCRVIKRIREELKGLLDE